MIERNAKKRLEYLFQLFKIVAVTGPRQSGKTTLVRSSFPNKPYVNFEDPETRQYAIEDPKGFLSNYKQGAVFDEVQRVPDIFSYLQLIVDEKKASGQFILTGSNNLLLNQHISQSLAGRIAFLNLLPFSYQEIKDSYGDKESNIYLFQGMYPAIYDQQIPPNEWYPNYIRTYVERDVRQIKNITDLLVFEKFMRLLAGRTGQELNYSSLSVEVGVDVKTIQSWIGILESSYIIYLLKPFHKNYNKTIVKRPKIYFIDTGLASSLLNLSTLDHISNHPLRGALFETLVISEVLKYNFNNGEPLRLYYWRDKTGREIDLIIEKGLNIIPIEIKSTQTIQKDFFKHLKYWMKLSGANTATLLYDGDQQQKYSNGIVVHNWKLFQQNPFGSS